MSIPSYQLKAVLQADAHTLIRRGIRDSDGTPVLIKTIQAASPSLEAIARLKYEYNILRSLDLPGVTRAYTLEDLPHGPALILEDFGAVPLCQLIQQAPLDLPNFLTIGLQLAETLAQLHQARIIHKNIRSLNIWVQPGSGQTKLEDFSLATRLDYERQTVSSPQKLEGTLAYLSPEQSGRMNRAIDFRSDFYSLGIVFYEMLTGQVPFQAIDPLELVHCHIARSPTPPQLLNPDLPRAVADIVMKLLAKTAEDRYQSALGLKADLEICWNQLQTFGDVTPFLVGQLDHYSQFLIPQKLYGRDAEVRALMAAIERVARSETTELMLVSGYSGIGKSSLVNEIHRSRAHSDRFGPTNQRGYFIRGKFDPFQRHSPYAAVIQALQDLLRQLLTEPDDRIADWRICLNAALGGNGQVMVNVLPELKRIIGPQPPVPPLGATAAQNRLNRVFQQFIQAFCQPGQPLVLFLDNLQWADLASLHLIQQLLGDRELKCLLLIGAYREHEVGAVHPLRVTLDAIQATGNPIASLVLQPLQREHVTQLLAETLRAEDVQPLAARVHDKTQGNPFCLMQLLKSLYQERGIWFDFQTGGWRWEVDRLDTIMMTENDVDQRDSQPLHLTPETQEVLKLTALDLATVIKVNQAFSGEIIFEKLLNQLMSSVIENAGATSGALLLKRAENLVLVADTIVGQPNTVVTPEKPLEACNHLAIPLIQYVMRSQTPLVLNDASQERLFVSDLYIAQTQPKSILCLPIIYQNTFKGILYLENTLAQGAFTSQHLELLSLLSGQIAISLDNAILYQASQTYLQQLELNNQQLSQTNTSLAAEIHDRQQAEVERDRFFTLSLDMLCIATFEGYFVRLNPAWERILGYTQAELTAQPYLEFVHPDDRDRTIAEARQLTQGTETVSFENRYRCKDGSYRWIAWQVAPFPEQQLLYAVAHDITARKQAEADYLRLAEEREQLLLSERAARLEAERANRLKDEFLAVLSHELRTPLGPILGWVQFLRTRPADAAVLEKALETIERNAKLQTQLIEDLLDGSRILQDKLNLTTYPVSLAGVIQQAIDIARLTAQEKTIEIVTQIDPDIRQVLGDPHRLQQVLWNLLSNAIKFSPEQGKVTVQLTEQPAGWAQITVSDKGKGINPEFLPYVFDRFRQADSSITRSYGGLGLGLAIARHLVELHGGTITASSPGEGQGATFTIRLPLDFRSSWQNS